jgi:16S rRNA processing protein RimM
MVLVGRVVRPHGNRGNVVVHPETDFGADRFRPGATVFWQRGGTTASVEVVESREHDGRWIVGFGGVGSMNDAEELRGLELRIPLDAMAPAGDGRYYVHDLVGCLVTTPAGDEIGRVDRVETATGIPLLVVEGRGGEVLIPFTAAICTEVDVQARRIAIDPPEGLIELNARGRRDD